MLDRYRSPAFGRFLLITLLCVPAVPWAVDYHVAASGADTNPGTASKPWRTIARVNGAALAPGDRVLLRRGDSWAETLRPRNSGLEGRPIVYSAYGAGPLPVITGDANDHCVEWGSTRRHLVFESLHLRDCGQPSGTRRGAFASWNEGADSEGIVIQDCVLSNARTWNIYLTGVDGLVIRGNVIRDANLEHGIYLDGSLGMNDVVIEGNDIYGNADMCVQFNPNGAERLTNVVVRYNRIHDCPQGGLNNLGADAAQVHHNLFYGNNPAIYNTCDGADSGCIKGARGGVYAHNTILTSGSGYATCFYNGSRLGTPTFAAFENNICVYDADRGEAFANDEVFGEVRVDNNLYFSRRTASPVFVWQGKTYYGFADYRSASGSDLASRFADPEFADAAGLDFTPGPGSPAIDQGADLGYARDLDGRSVPSGSYPDIGALEAAALDPGPIQRPENLRRVPPVGGG